MCYFVKTHIFTIFVFRKNVLRMKLSILTPSKNLVPSSWYNSTVRQPVAMKLNRLNDVCLQSFMLTFLSQEYFLLLHRHQFPCLPLSFWYNLPIISKRLYTQ